jgi:hypothetical protein
MLIAAFSIAVMRARVFTPRLAVSAAILAIATAPHYLWALQNLQQTTQRMAKLDRESSAFSVIDIPVIGLDGVLSLATSFAAWAAPLLIAWFALRYVLREETGADNPADAERRHIFAQFFGRTTLIAIGAFAAIILFGDLHSVRERYLTPMLMPLPFWLAFAWPLEQHSRAPVHFLRVSAVIAALMVTAWPLWILFGKDQFAYPYQAFATALGQATPDSFAVLGPHDKYGANIAIRLERASPWTEEAHADRVMVLWEPKAGRSANGLAARLGEGFEPRGGPITMSAPYDNLSGQQVRLNGQLYARKP